MGQIFYMTIYDPETRKCYSEDSDKFHSNCYSFSWDIRITHYLLRQKPYHVMWCGDYVLIDNCLENFSEVQLLGISVSKDLEIFTNNGFSPDSEKVKFIAENHETWDEIGISMDEINEFFDFDNSNSVKYDGFLINHSKKQAIDLKKYYEKSLLYDQKFRKYLVDLIPSLTETGTGIHAGTHMALFDGCSAEVTENLVGQWCGDLLEIVDQSPKDYDIINCCFAPVWERVRYCVKEFGFDKENFVLKNKNKDRFEAVKLSFILTKGRSSYIKIEYDEDKTYYKGIPKSEVKSKEENTSKNKNKNINNPDNNISKDQGNKKRKI